MQTKNNLADRRVQRTQQLLRTALIELILEKGYEAITVQDIIDRANVGRSTFYAHFWDKDQLLLSGLDKLRDSIQEQYQGSHFDNKEHVDISLIIFRHAQDHQQVYKALVGKRGGTLINRQFFNYMTELLREHVTALQTTLLPKETASEIPLEISVQAVAGTLAALLIWWLDNDLPYSAEQMTRWFHQLSVQPMRELFSYYHLYQTEGQL